MALAPPVRMKQPNLALTPRKTYEEVITTREFAPTRSDDAMAPVMMDVVALGAAKTKKVAKAHHSEKPPAEYATPTRTVEAHKTPLIKHEMSKTTSTPVVSEAIEVKGSRTEITEYSIDGTKPSADASVLEEKTKAATSWLTHRWRMNDLHNWMPTGPNSMPMANSRPHRALWLFS